MKPSLPSQVGSGEFLMKVRDLLDIAFGRRTNRIAPPAEMTAVAAASAPTKAEYDALLTDVQNLRAKMVEYHARFDEE